ncbi:P-loop containing nucleoside triphosphate hydrolase protein [Phaeosphaeriaceae sp. PMI808]|nr:P-loop containing nucleoside triphosphate hydrolase protein [Phaeosphaeriaceae sp. PMI808]
MAKRHRNQTNRPKHATSNWTTNKHSFTQSNNTFANLPNLDHNSDEVNTHLKERFSRASPHDNSSAPNVNISSYGSSFVNNDIRKYFELEKKPFTAAGSWIDKPEIPDPSEILPLQRPDLSESHALIDIDAGEHIRPHKAYGPYENNEEYLSTKYELLREDFIQPFRKMMDEFRKNPYKDEAEYNDKNIGIYDPVHITSLVFSPRGLATRVAFSLSRVKKFIRWEQSKRLITGTLVALSPTDDAFQTTCIFAVVAARPIAALQQNPPEIDLFFARPEEQEIDPTKKWVMVECRGSFFEASRHTLRALQHLMREPFPLSEHLVSVQKEVEPPSYVRDNPYMNLSSLVSMEDSASFENVNILEEWPASSSLSLDASQSKALKRMLTSKIAIVQGPPGTGKTHVSVVMMKVQRDNMCKDDSPIIITAQTNHAVDQILRHTKEFEPNFIRLGGRSKDPEIKKRTLFEVRGSNPRKKPGSQKIQATVAMRKLTNTCQMLLAPLEVGKPPLDHRILSKLGIITHEQAESLKDEGEETMGISSSDNPGILIEQWLGNRVAPCHRPSQPDDYDWSYEEEDLEFEQLQEIEAEAFARDDDDIEMLRGSVTLLSDNWSGKGGSKLTWTDIRDLLQKTSDLTTIPPIDRGAVYNFFKREVKLHLVTAVRQIATQYNETVLQRKVGLWEEDSHLLRKQRIIGCTTTGLSKYRALLASLHPRIILVEEAAETMEAPVTAACLPSLQHLIIVGDHQQLRPHTNVHSFEDEPYYLNLSLFERLVRNDVTYSTLTRQRRMIPEIRRLLTPIYEDTLKDHESVKELANRPPVEGMGGTNSFFFCHDWPESRDNNMSCYNEYEANMIVGFVDYLILNGIDAVNITLLTFYNGQRKYLIRALRNHKNFQAFTRITVVTVDSYQGEENDIVILSLVRSNRKHAIGFLSSDNRACVALSRAKRGFYIFGNAELLACESRVWAHVVDIMYKDTKVKVKSGQKRRVGYHLPLQCRKHGRKEWIQVPDDWELIHGGCLLRCGGILPCQHPCPYRCHPFGHDQVNCKMQCNRLLNCNHRCVRTCCDACTCQKCGRGTNGVQPMLKTVPSGIQPSNRLTTLSTAPNHLFSSHMTPTRFFGTFMHEGARVEDDQVLQKEAEAKYPDAFSSISSMRLTEESLSKLTVSKNAELLIDLDVGPKLSSYANAASMKSKGKTKTEVIINLID